MNCPYSEIEGVYQERIGAKRVETGKDGIAVVNDENWEVDTSTITQWKMKDKWAVDDAMKAWAETGDERKVLPILTQFIKKWPYAGDPTVNDSYGELDKTEFGEAVNRVLGAFRQFAADAKNTSVSGSA